MSEQKIETTRDEQVIMQAHFRVKGSSITLNNQQSILTERTRLAMKGLIDKGILEYHREKEREFLVSEKGYSEVEYGPDITESDDFIFNTKKEDKEFIPIV